jgi:YD repeat-containing protein
VTGGFGSVKLVHCHRFSRIKDTTDNLGTVGYSYDAASRRLTMTYPGGGLTINYDYDTLGNVLKIRENGATSGVGVLASYTYDNAGRRDLVTFGNGAVQDFTFDAAQRLQSLTNDLSGTASDLTQSFTYNPAGQIGSITRTNPTDAYA